MNMVILEIWGQVVVALGIGGLFILLSAPDRPQRTPDGMSLELDWHTKAGTILGIACLAVALGGFLLYWLGILASKAPELVHMFYTIS